MINIKFLIKISIVFVLFSVLWFIVFPKSPWFVLAIPILISLSAIIFLAYNQKKLETKIQREPTVKTNTSIKRERFTEEELKSWRVHLINEYIKEKKLNPTHEQYKYLISRHFYVPLSFVYDHHLGEPLASIQRKKFFEVTDKSLASIFSEIDVKLSTDNERFMAEEVHTMD